MASFMEHIHRIPIQPPAPAQRCIAPECGRTDDLTTVYHGHPEGATACRFHAQRYFLAHIAAAHETQLDKR